MGKQFSKEEKIAAVKLYEKLGHIAWVMEELGYPTSRTLLYIWIKEYKENGLNGLDKKKKYSEEQKNKAIEYYLTNGMSISKTITALGYPKKTLMQEWLNEKVPKGIRKWHCKSNENVVRYTQEQKEEVKLYCSGERPKDIAEKLSVRPESIRVWSIDLLGKDKISSMNKKRTKRTNETNETTEDLKKTINDLETKCKELEREVYRLQMQKDILEKADEIIKKGKGIHLEKLSNREKADLIDALRKKYRLNELMKELHIAKSSYCYQECSKSKPDKYAEVRNQIKTIFNENYMSYGYRRIYGTIRRMGIIISEKVIRKIMKEDGLRVRIIEQRKYSSYKGEISPEVPNILERNFHSDVPNTKWLTDITEFRIPAGKIIYLSPMIDCFDGYVVSWLNIPSVECT